MNDQEIRDAIKIVKLVAYMYMDGEDKGKEALKPLVELAEQHLLRDGESQAHFNCVSDNARLEQELATLRAENKSLKTSRDGLKALADMYQNLNGELKKENVELNSYLDMEENSKDSYRHEYIQLKKEKAEMIERLKGIREVVLEIEGITANEATTGYIKWAKNLAQQIANYLTGT